MFSRKNLAIFRHSLEGWSPGLLQITPVPFGLFTPPQADSSTTIGAAFRPDGKMRLFAFMRDIQGQASKIYSLFRVSLNCGASVAAEALDAAITNGSIVCLTAELCISHHRACRCLSPVKNRPRRKTLARKSPVMTTE